MIEKNVAEVVNAFLAGLLLNFSLPPPPPLRQVDSLPCAHKPVDNMHKSSLMQQESSKFVAMLVYGTTTGTCLCTVP